MADVRKTRVGLIVPDYRANTDSGGGVAVVADFLRRAIDTCPDLEVELVAVTTNSRDLGSRRLRAPRTLARRSLYSEKFVDGVRVHHFGANFVEIETQRYRPRKELTSFLRRFDVLQVVSGSPALAAVAGQSRRPILIQAATLIRWERADIRAHGSFLERTWRKIMTARMDRVDRRAARLADQTFVSNEAMLRELKKLSNGEVLLCPPGIDTSKFRPGGGAGGYGQQRPYLLTVCRLNDPRKNLSLLFRVYARLRSELPNPPELVLAGRGDLRAEDRATAARLGIERHIRVQRAVSEDELVRLYQGCACFVLTSLEEGFGLVIAEALACGAPAVTTRTAGAAYILEGSDAGLLCSIDANVEQGLLESLLRVLTDQTVAKKMSEEARNLVVSRFSMRSAAEPFLAAYRRYPGLRSPERRQ